MAAVVVVVAATAAAVRESGGFNGRNVCEESSAPRARASALMNVGIEIDL